MRFKINGIPRSGKFGVINKYDSSTILFRGTKRQCQQFMDARQNIFLTIKNLEVFDVNKVK